MKEESSASKVCVCTCNSCSSLLLASCSICARCTSFSYWSNLVRYWCNNMSKRTYSSACCLHSTAYRGATRGVPTLCALCAPCALTSAPAPPAAPPPPPAPAAPPAWVVVAGARLAPVCDVDADGAMQVTSVHVFTSSSYTQQFTFK